MSEPTLFDEFTPNTLAELVEALIRRHGFDAVEEAVGAWKIQHGGPIRQVGEREGDQRTSKGQRSSDVRRFRSTSHSGRLLLRFVKAGDTGLTDKEAADLVVGDVLGGDVSIARWEGCRRRCSDLRLAGYIIDTGYESEDRIRWKASPDGLAAASRLQANGWSR